MHHEWHFNHDDDHIHSNVNNMVRLTNLIYININFNYSICQWAMCLPFECLGGWHIRLWWWLWLMLGATIFFLNVKIIWILIILPKHFYVIVSLTYMFISIFLHVVIIEPLTSLTLYPHCTFIFIIRLSSLSLYLHCIFISTGPAFTCPNPRLAYIDLLVSPLFTQH